MKKPLLLVLLFLASFTNAQCVDTLSAGITVFAIDYHRVLWGWGYNMQEQLGANLDDKVNVPTPLTSDSNWVFVASGSRGSQFAIKDDGTLWCGGANFFGQLADGTRDNRTFPARLGNDSDWKSISAGAVFTLAIKNDGSLWAWGFNGYGSLGDSTRIDKLYPTRIGTENDWKIVDAGDSHALGIKQDGSLWAWGNNEEGRAGLDTSLRSLWPVRIGTGTNWKSIQASNKHSVALRADGTIWACGWNVFGSIGQGVGAADTYRFTKVGTDNNWIKISSKSDHTLALKADGSVYTWGRGLEASTWVNHYYSPTLFDAAIDWNEIYAGSYCNFASKSSSSHWTWGSNRFGERANGNLNYINTISLLDCAVFSTSDWSKLYSNAKVYPNPSSGELNFQWADGSNERTEFSLFDLNGRLCYKREAHAFDRIRLPELPKGIYLVRLKAKDATSKTLRLIIQ